MKEGKLLTGLDRLDTVLDGGLEPGLHVILGPTSSGKSSLEGTIMMNLAKRGVPVGRVCLNMMLRQISERMLAREADVSLQDLRTGNSSEEDLFEADKANTRMKDWPSFAVGGPMDLNAVCAWIRDQHEKNGLRAASVDMLADAGNDDPASLGDRKLSALLAAERLHELGLELGIPILGTVTADVGTDVGPLSCSTLLRIETKPPSPRQSEWDVVMQVWKGSECEAVCFCFEADRFRFRDVILVV